MQNNTQLPASFISRIETDLGSQSQAFLQSLLSESPISIRFNPYKPVSNNYTEKVPWSQFAYYLKSRPVFTLDPLFHAGSYYVQEASSMFLEQVLKQTLDLGSPLRVLDLCAAPGGKSTHIASLITADSLLVSNEVIRSRAKILAENITKWGVPNVVVTNNDPSAFEKLSGFFDAIVVDAPCSGEGLFRKDPNAISEWSIDNVQLCAARQRRIVADAWTALKPGGVLIYSTCTYNNAENDENIQWMLNEMDATPLPIDTQEFPEIMASKQALGYHFYPHKTKGEGFFIAAVKKNEGQNYKQGKLKKMLISKANQLISKEIAPWIEWGTPLEHWAFQDKIFAFPKNLSHELMALTEHLSLIQAGTEICEIKARNLVPSHALAISTILNKKAFPSIDLSLTDALTYLRKEDIKPDTNANYVLPLFNKIPLGFLKKAGNRYNNLYPKEWRIRMEINI